MKSLVPGLLSALCKKTHKKSQPCDEAGEIISGDGKDEIYGVALGVGEMVSSQPMVCLEISDHGFGRRSSFQLAFDLHCDASFLAADINPEVIGNRRMMAVATMLCIALRYPLSAMMRYTEPPICFLHLE